MSWLNRHHTRYHSMLLVISRDRLVIGCCDCWLSPSTHTRQGRTSKQSSPTTFDNNEFHDNRLDPHHHPPTEPHTNPRTEISHAGTHSPFCNTFFAIPGGGDNFGAKLSGRMRFWDRQWLMTTLRKPLDQIDQDEKAPWACQCRSRSCRKAQKTYVYDSNFGMQRADEPVS